MKNFEQEQADKLRKHMSGIDKLAGQFGAVVVSFKYGDTRRDGCVVKIANEEIPEGFLDALDDHSKDVHLLVVPDAAPNYV